MEIVVDEKFFSSTRLGSFLVTSLIEDPSKQHSSVESASGQQTSDSVALRRETPATITIHTQCMFFVYKWNMQDIYSIHVYKIGYIHVLYKGYKEASWT